MFILGFILFPSIVLTPSLPYHHSVPQISLAPNA